MSNPEGFPSEGEQPNIEIPQPAPETNRQPAQENPPAVSVSPEIQPTEAETQQEILALRQQVENAYSQEASPLSQQEMESHKFISDLGERGEVHTSRVYGLATEKMLPLVGIKKEEAPPLVFSDGERANLNVENSTPEINVGRDEFVRDIADTLGEEVGHFMRWNKTDKIETGGEENLTDEFFGFVGRRLFFNQLTPQERESLFPDGDPSLRSTYEGKTKRQILDEIKPKGQLKRKLDKEFKAAEQQGNSERMEQIANEAREGGVGDWYKTLSHYRGYEFAEKLDMGKITDWTKLFSMTDAEVRHRFFTSNPDYSGL